jgi:membrane-bound lytic murein transglycosylase B
MSVPVTPTQQDGGRMGGGGGPRRSLAVALVALASITACRSSSDGSDSESASTKASTTTAVAGQPTTTSTMPASTTVLPPHLGSSSPLPSVPQPGEPVAAESAAGMAAQLTEAWATISDTSAAEAEVARAAHVEQVVVRALSSTKSNLRAATLAALAPELRTHESANVDASAKLRSLVGKPRTALPQWRIVDPAPAAELRGYYDEAQADYGVPWQYLAAVNFVETRFGRIRGTSEAGAQGPMQFLPSTWRQYGEGGDINSYRDSIRAAARYLKRNGAPGDMRNALYNYNHSDLYVDAVLAYGDRMATDEAAFRAYYRWQVYYLTTAGDVWLPTGYGP